MLMYAAAIILYSWELCNFYTFFSRYAWMYAFMYVFDFCWLCCAMDEWVGGEIFYFYAEENLIFYFSFVVVIVFFTLNNAVYIRQSRHMSEKILENWVNWRHILRLVLSFYILYRTFFLKWFMWPQWNSSKINVKCLFLLA